MIRLKDLRHFFSFSFKNVSSLIHNIPESLIKVSPHKIEIKTELPAKVMHLPGVIECNINGDLLQVQWRDFCGYIYTDNTSKNFELVSDSSIPTWISSSSFMGNTQNLNREEYFILDNSSVVLFTNVLKLNLSTKQIMEIMNSFENQGVRDYSLYGLTIYNRLKAKIQEESKNSTKEGIESIPFGIIFADIIED